MKNSSDCQAAFMNYGFERDSVFADEPKSTKCFVNYDLPYNTVTLKKNIRVDAVLEEGVGKDPWSLPELKNNETPWKELSSCGKARRAVCYVIRLTLLLGLLYLFISSLGLLSAAFRLLGGKAAGEALSNTVLFNNPIAGVMLGVMATVLVQSSSTSTSIVVSMVSAGLLEVYMAIPMVMGANIGTTVTNTLVAVGQASVRGDFRRAFAGATVHDMFNWLSVLLFLPLEWSTGYLYHLSGALVGGIHYEPGTGSSPELLKAITKPFTKRIVQLSSSKIRDIALGIKVNGSLIKGNSHLFSSWSYGDGVAGTILLVASLILLCACLLSIVKLLGSLLKGTIASLLQRFINSDLPGPLRHLTGYLAILIGAGFTVLVQSSSIFTSSLTPLVGIGAIHIDRMYPLTLGSNLGTTVTSILAAMAVDSSGFKNSLQVALCHLFFNISGIAVWYPIPVLRGVPIKLSKRLGNTVFTYRWFALVYILCMYFLMPLTVLGLSMAGWQVLLAVTIPVSLFLIFVVVLSTLQAKCPHSLPARLRSWRAIGLPEPLRSLNPYDRVLTHMRRACFCCCKRSETLTSDTDIVCSTSRLDADKTEEMSNHVTCLTSPDNYSISHVWERNKAERLPHSGEGGFICSKETMSNSADIEGSGMVQNNTDMAVLVVRKTENNTSAENKIAMTTAAVHPIQNSLGNNLHGEVAPFFNTASLNTYF